MPFWVLALLSLALGAQCAWQLSRAPTLYREDLPPAPRAQALRLASFAEDEAAARLTMLYLQTFDFGGGNRIPYQKLDYTRLVGWLESILELDPRSDYPLFSAARIYAEVPDPARSRIVLEFIYRAFFDDPNRRWPWLAHASLVAKHRLGDLPLALRYAQAVQRHTTDPKVPLWARQMEIFILEDMDELEAAKIMIRDLLESGRIYDPAELRFLKQRLEELEGRLSKSRR